jgi:LacI family transcriptional regulator
MSVTIDDISRQLGISVSTVSKALNDYPDVSQETRERVKAAALALDYHPSSAARNLRRGRSDKIGLLINNPISFISEYISEIMAGAALSAENYNQNLILYTTAVDHPDRLKRICRAREVDGLMLIFQPSDEAVAVLEKEGMPFIVFGRRIEHPNVSYIAPDNQDGSYRLTTHLIEQGHQRIGFTTRPQLGTVSEDRFAGYRQALDEAGIPFDPNLIIETVIEPLSGRRAFEALLKLSDPPTALFALYDLMAVDAAQAAQERGMIIPDDIAIAGFDSWRASLMTTPAITTVQQPLQNMSQMATDMLLRRIQDNSHPPERHTLPVQLIVSASTKRKIHANNN